MQQAAIPTSAPDADPTRATVAALVGLRARAEPLHPPRTRAARAPLTGAHRSRLRGRGMDYRESRHYQPGDDIRTMDWRITARAGRAHVKVFDEERERPVVLLVDLGASMFFASRGVFKSVQAARLAALIGWSAIAHGDRIGALIFGPGGHQELPPTAGRRGQMQLIRALLAATDPIAGLATTAPEPTLAPPPAALTTALIRLRRVARPGSLVVLLSDFYGRDADTARHLGRLARHSELVAIQIVDPLEQAPPPPGRYPISDGRGHALLDTLDRGTRSRYTAHFAAHHAAVQALIATAGCPLLRCATDADPVDCLAGAFATRPRGVHRPHSPDPR